ncbi:MAG: HAD hydrolase family protein [Deltaproteobacteria bacterium]|nr:HAD hydrolase family protein [Deltaproteobacteria bacterium]
MTGRLDKPSAGELQARAAAVKLLVLDVDGVLTDGGLYYGPSGEALKRFNVKDGHGIVMARLSGLPTAVLTARTSEMVAVRGRELGLAAVLQGRRDKAAGFAELCDGLKVQPSECAYMGDDTNDLPVLQRCGLPACPADAVAEVRAASAFIARAAGGHGAVRELVELCLKASGRWEAALSHATGNGLPPR